jgi:SSS family transporter
MSTPGIFASVFFLYLALLFAIGILSRIRSKNTISDFYLGGRNLGPWISSFSFVAAYFSSVVIIGGGGFGYKYGMTTIWIGVINVLIGTALAWMVLGKRTRIFSVKLNALTLPELLKKCYKAPEMQLISAVITVIFLVIYNVSILKGMAHLLEGLLNISYLTGLLISSVVIIIYVFLGGYLAVVWTGFIQAWVMIGALLILTFATVSKVGGISLIFARLSEINERLITVPGLWNYSGLISYCLIVSFGVWGMPQLVNRFYSIKDTKVLRIGTVLATLGATMAVLPYFSGAASRIFFPHLDNPDLAIPLLVKTVLSPLGQAVFLTGVIAAGMSTFSAVLIICVSSLIKDILVDSFKLNLSEKQHLLYARLSSIVIGILSLIIAVKPPAMILVLTAFSWTIIAATNLWPYFLGLYIKNPVKLSGVLSMFTGIISSLIWLSLKNPLGIHGFIPGILIGFISYWLGYGIYKLNTRNKLLTSDENINKI